MGSFFSVPSPDSKQYLILYQNVAGTALEVDRYPNSKAIEDIGIEDQSTDVSGLVFAVVDDEGRRTWIEAGKDGRPSAHAAEKIGEVLTAENAPGLAEGVAAKAVDEVGIEALSTLNDLAFAVVDDAGRRTWVEAGKDGKPTQHAIDAIVEKLPGGLGEAPATYQSGAKGALGIVSGPNITCWGDSMTAGAGGGGTTYPAVLQSLLTAAGYTSTVFNRGVGGENAPTICARAGGNPFIALPEVGLFRRLPRRLKSSCKPSMGR